MKGDKKKKKTLLEKKFPQAEDGHKCRYIIIENLRAMCEESKIQILEIKKKDLILFSEIRITFFE